MADDGEEGKRKGMARAARAADPEWWRVTLMCVRDVAQGKPWFIFDDVEALRRERFSNYTTREHRANGPLMREAQRLGYCEPTDDWYESKQRVNHRRPMRVWWSLIYHGPRPAIRRRRRRLDPRQLDFFA